MRILFIERKGISPEAVREGRTHFEEALRTSTIIMITCPRTPETLNLISAPELALMRPNAIMVNVARGSIVDESCLVQALKEGKIGGAATDVFIQEPATKENSVLVKAAGEEWAQGKLTLSPHVAWWARSSIEKLRRTVTENIEAWARGEPTNLV
jgi:lactate dehydrogenase-like 2-hydroxyacid dehydrogenase